jgi:hypothetical protein
MMSHSTQLACWLHKQLTLKYTFASLADPFETRYSGVKRDSGLLKNYTHSRTDCAIVSRAWPWSWTFPLSRHVPAVSADSEESGDLHLEKNCSKYFADGGPAGGFCKFVYSNIPDIIPVGSYIFVDQAFGIPEVPPPLSGLKGDRPMLDSNALIYVGTGDWAVGHCTLDGTTFLGLCNFSDGVGKLAGFQARWDVSGCPAPPKTTAACPVAGTPNFAYIGTYSFSP